MLRIALLLLLGMLVGPAANALSPDLKLSQLMRGHWGIKDGLPGRIHQITQSDDGFLWLGTTAGLVRFDGMNFMVVDKLGGTSFGTPNVLQVRAGHGHDLLMSFGSQGVANYEDGHLARFQDDRDIGAPQWLSRDSDGRIWGVGKGHFFTIDHGHLQRAGVERNLPDQTAYTGAVDRHGTVWAVTNGNGDKAGTLSFLPRGETAFHSFPISFDPGEVTVAPDGTLWFAHEGGLSALIVKDGSPRQVKELVTESVGRTLVDRDGALWVQTERGLSRIRDVMSTLDAGHASLTDDEFVDKSSETTDVRTMFEDRDGNVWVATGDGLERFRNPRFAQAALPKARPWNYLVAATNSGAIWTCNGSGGLVRLADGHVTAFDDKRFETVSSAYSDPAGTLWAGTSNALLKSVDAATFVEIPLAPGMTGGNDSINKIVMGPTGELWVDAGSARAFIYADGAWRSPSERHGLPKDWGFQAALADSTGRLWFASGSEIDIVDHGETRHLGRANSGIDLGRINVLALRGTRLWVGGERGVAYYDGQRFHDILDEKGRPHGNVTGVAETRNGDLWINLPNETLRISAATLSRAYVAPDTPLAAEHLDDLDGRQGIAGPSYVSPSLAEATDGRIWIATTAGIAWARPGDVRRHAKPTTTLIEGLIADGRAVGLGRDNVLPPLLKHLEVAYTAPAMSVPERVQFRYRLDGIDSDWQSAGTRRTAYYGELSPGTYRFHVMSSNEDGDWATPDTAIDITVQPAWFQTWWFRCLCVAVAIGLLWTLVRVRVRVLTNRVGLQLRVQLAERERIARDIHDTLLQSFYGVSIQLNSLADRIAADDPGRERIRAVLRHADDALSEGRDRIQGLREDLPARPSLAAALREEAAALAVESGSAFELVVFGTERPLRSVAFDEINKAATEGLRNAFMHAKARKILVALTFTRGHLQVVLRDDGVGMDPMFLKAGRSRHWGLFGMQERIKGIGGSIRIESSTDKGTTITIRVHAAIAFLSPRRPWFARSLGRALHASE